jgi:hypothetical protein
MQQDPAAPELASHGVSTQELNAKKFAASSSTHSCCSRHTRCAAAMADNDAAEIPICCGAIYTCESASVLAIKHTHTLAL